MATKSQKVKLGIFLIVSTALLVGSLALLIGVNLFEARDKYIVRFNQSVSGLEIGAPVKLKGVRVGIVERIHVPDNVEVVEVKISLEKGTPIKKDTRAEIQMQGITGLKYLELTGGTREAKPLPEGGVIKPGESTFEAITGRANAISLKAEKVLNNLLNLTRGQNRERIGSVIKGTDQTLEKARKMFEDVGELAESANEVIGENRNSFKSLIRRANSSAMKLETTLQSTDATVDQLHGDLKQMELGSTVADFRRTNDMIQKQLEALDLTPLAKQLTRSLRALTEALSRINATLGDNEHQVEAVIQNIRSITESIKEFSRLIERKPSRLIFSEEPKERDIR